MKLAATILLLPSLSLAQITAPTEWSGSAKLFGTDVPARIVVSPDGAALLDFRGDVHFRRCFDGTNAWADDFGTPPSTLHFSERDSIIAIGAALSGEWNTDHSPLTISRTDNAISFTIPDSPLHGTITADDHNHATSITISAGEHDSTLTIRGWHESNGLWSPESITLASASIGNFDITFTSAKPATADAFARPDPTSAAATFDPAIPAQLEVKRAKTGHLLVKPVINGQTTGWFIFDTGAGATVLDKTTAAKLNVKQFGEIEVGGVGGHVTSPLSQPETFTLGPATVARPTFITLDLAPIGAAIGEDLAGVAGYDLLSRVVAIVDSTDGTIALADPRTYQSDGQWSTLYLYERHACIDATVEGHTGVFKLDTGSNTAVTMHAPAVKRFNMLEGRDTKPAKIGGSGGFRTAKQGTLKNVIFGGREYTDVKAIFSEPAGDVFGDPSTLGNIGGPFLKDFTLTLDYTNERMMLVPKVK